FTRFLYEEDAADKTLAGYNIHGYYIPPGNYEYIWLATGNGLVKLKPETGETERFFPKPDKNTQTPGNYLFRITPDPYFPDVLWITGLYIGLLRFDVQTEEFTLYDNDPTDPLSLPESSGRALIADRSGTMWMGHSTFGLSKFNPRAVNFRHLTHDPENAQSLPSNIVWAIYEDNNGIFWIVSGDLQNNLTRFDPVTNIYRHFDSKFNSSGTQLSGAINSFIEDKSGRLWIGTSTGLHLFNTKTGTTRHFQGVAGDKNSRDNLVFFLLPMAKNGNKFWAATRTGVKIFDTDTGKFSDVSVTKDKDDAMVFITLFEDTNQVLWGGAYNDGLIKINPLKNTRQIYAYNPGDTTTISNNRIYTIMQRETEPGILWLGTAGGGLNRFDISTGTATHFTKEDGLPDNTIYGILEDNNGTLWMSTNNGISNYDPEEGSFRNYGVEDGLLSTEYSQVSFFKDSHGIMYFGGGEGLTAFVPENLQINNTPPQVVLSNFKIFNESIVPGPDSPLSKPLDKTTEISLDHNQNEVSFEFVALHYTNSAKNRYRYRLEGFDEDWVDAGGLRAATYTNLEPGEYTFRVKASNSDGVWNEEGASIQLSISPPWYRTWWAYGCYLALLILGIYFIDQLQRKRILGREREKAREKELVHAKEIEKAYKNLEIAHESLKSTQEQLIQQEKLASLGQLTAGIAHEIKNPLNFVNNFSELNMELLDEAFEETKKLGNSPIVDEIVQILLVVKSNLQKIHQHGTRADGIVKSMLQHSRGGTGKMEPTDINAVIEEYVNLAFHGMRAGKNVFNVSIALQLDESIGKIPLIGEDFSRVILNLCNNAF
ncbi:MAG TPA: two-component regulator propeller domain-containing protein, partial [Aequorivita sp.]|nr:two-component regulator propeller domain-containing protein [Aequorivita sp.]